MLFSFLDRYFERLFGLLATATLRAQERAEEQRHRSGH